MTSGAGTAVNLTELRVNKGFSQAAAARAAGVKKSVWGRAENGEPVAPKNQFKIATLFNLKPTDIWPLDDEEAEAAA